MKLFTQHITKKLEDVMKAQKRADYYFMIYRLQLEKMESESFSVPEEALVSDDYESYFSQFSEICKSDGATTMRERSELSNVLNVFQNKFEEIASVCEKNIKIIHAAWEVQYFNRENS